MDAETLGLSIRNGCCVHSFARAGLPSQDLNMFFWHGAEALPAQETSKGTLA